MIMKKTTISEVLMPQRILTVDSSTSSIAFAVFDRGSLVSYGKINLVGSDVYLKAGNCCGKFYALIKKIKPDAVVVESPIYSNSPKTAMHLALVQGALYGSSYMAGVRVFRAISPIQWQNYVGTRLLTSEEKSAIEKSFPNKSNSWYKTITTKRWKTLNRILTPRTWLWMMTGTPAAQSPLDAYGLAKMCVPDTTPMLFGGFRDSVMQQLTRFKWIPRPSAEATVHRLLQPAIRFTKDECLDLPEVTHTSRYAPLSPQQSKYYKQLKKDMMIEAAGEEVSAVNAASNITKLLQISCGAVYTDTGNVVEFDVSNRLSAVLEVIEEATHKVLVFAPFTHTLALLKDFLVKHKVTTEIIDGSVSVNKRTDTFKRFQEQQDPKVLLIQPQAAAHGVTLTAANVVIWYAPVTSIESYLQANARVHRQGQVNPVTVVHIEGSPVETKLYAMLQNKLNFHTRIIDLYKNEINT